MEINKETVVLLTNDDGFYAEGLQTLYSKIKDSTLTVTVAPDRERSAVGHGITMHQPLRAKLVRLDGMNHWTVDGTPSDCVKLAVEHLLQKKQPSLIISGINRGSNMGNDVLYSGTVSAAIEGFFYGIPSIAASAVGYGRINFEKAAQFLLDNLELLKKLASGTVLNINFPDLSEQTDYKGVKFTKLGKRIYQNVFEERKDPRGESYFWMGGEPVSLEQLADSDIAAVEAGYISVTPLNFDLTDRQVLSELTKNNFSSFK